MLESKKENIVVREKKEAEENFCWIEHVNGDIEGIIGSALYDLVKDENVELDKDNIYIKKVGQHLEIGRVKKIELIY